MTHFFANRSAMPPISKRPPMLDQRINTDAVRHAPSTIGPFSKPLSRNTNFMWKFTAPMEPMEQKLPMRSSQNDQLPSSSLNVWDWILASADGEAAPSGFWPMSDGLALMTNSTSGQASKSMAASAINAM